MEASFSTVYRTTVDTPVEPKSLQTYIQSSVVLLWVWWCRYDLYAVFMLMFSILKYCNFPGEKSHNMCSIYVQEFPQDASKAAFRPSWDNETLIEPQASALQ